MGEVIKLDLKKKSLRDVNSTLQNLDPKSNLRNYLISIQVVIMQFVQD